MNHGYYDEEKNHIAGQILLSYLIFAALRRLHFRNEMAIFASLFLLVSQAASFNVLGNDTTPQIFVTLFAFLSLCFLDRTLMASEKDHAQPTHAEVFAGLLSVFFFTLAVFSKETGLFFLPILILILIVRLRRTCRVGSTARTALIRMISYVAVAALFLVIRAQMGAIVPHGGDHYYAWSLGLHVPRNVALLALGLLVPVSTVRVYVAWNTSPFQCGVLLATAFAFLLLIILGLRRFSRWRQVTLVTAFLTLSAFPLAL